MNRMSVAIPAGLIAGSIVGLMFGGLWLQWQLVANLNTGNPFVLGSGPIDLPAAA